MFTTKRGMTGGLQTSSGSTLKGYLLNLLGLLNLCKSLTSLKVVRAGFTRRYRPNEGNRFVLVAAKMVLLGLGHSQ